MNLLFVIHYPVFGGPHNQALLLAETLCLHGVTTTVVLPREPGNAAQRLRDAGVEVVQMPLHRLRAVPDPRVQAGLLLSMPREIAALRRLISQRSIDIVQIGGLVNPHGALAARIERVPVVWQILDTRPPMAVRRAIMPLVVRLADVVMTTGRAVADVHPGASDIGERLQPFYPPVDPERFSRRPGDREAARAAFGFGPDDRLLVSVGNLNPQKGHEDLLRAAALVRRTTPEVKVLVVGAPHPTHREYERRLRGLAAKLGFRTGEDLVFAGAVSDVRPALAAADVFVLASVPNSEGAPTAIGEAMMMEVPVVATDVGAVREVVDDGQTGFVVPPLDAAAAAAAVSRLLDDPEGRARLAARGRARAIELFSARECARVHLEAFERALRHRRTTVESTP